MNTNRLPVSVLRRLVLSALVFLSACAVGPDYVRPQLDLGTEFLQTPVQDSEHGQWQRAAVSEAVPDTRWWEVFDDEELNRLMLALDASNPSLEQAQARYQQAQANLRQTRSGFFPQLDLSSSAGRSGNQGGVDNSYSLSANAAWEVDVWGRIRRETESGTAATQASKADMAATRLSLQSTLAQTYIRYRALEATERLLMQTVEAYARSLQINQVRVQAGYSPLSDAASARSQLENARTSLLAQARQKALLFHSLAVLTGQPPANFALQAGASWPEQPAIPTAIPTALLTQRPDITAAERRMAQANAQIGVAQAAWLPSFSLSASGGYRAAQLSDWFSAPAQFWSLGPALALSLFDAGGRAARVDAAKADYLLQVAAYRESVLTAIREVEDALAEVYGLEQEQASNARSLQAARESLVLMQNQFEAGLVDYLSLAQVETNLLSVERNELDLASERMQAAIRLLVALGGGWDDRLLQEAGQKQDAAPL